MYGQGPKLGEDWYERAPGVPMFFYDDASVARELGAYGITDVSEIDEPVAGGVVPVLQRHLRETTTWRILPSASTYKDGNNTLARFLRALHTDHASFVSKELWSEQDDHHDCPRNRLIELGFMHIARFDEPLMPNFELLL